jgi:hypothetical protein
MWWHVFQVQACLSFSDVESCASHVASETSLSKSVEPA